MKYTFTETRERVVARFSRHDGPEHPDYSAPTVVHLRILKRDQPMKVRGKTQPAGHVVGITVLEFPWAEYRAEDWEPADPNYDEPGVLGEFMAEEWRMSILEGWHL